jgi:ElaB/YqjD/DUF883 family membrane-anchored ribosome-binding protein
MAIYIPVISEFKSTGIDKAKKEFQSLEGAGQKTGFLLKKAFLPATAAIGAMAAGLFDAAKGAMEDEAASKELARSLRATTKATDGVIKATEDWITEQGRLLGVTDSDLRPALSRLARATGSVEEAQKLASQAMDISVATGKPLEAVVASLEKAYGGNLTALAKLAPEYRDMIREGASFEEVMAKLAETTGGAATEAANTAEGRFKRLKVSLDETKESIGASLIPVIEAGLPILEDFSSWAQDNPDQLVKVATGIGAITAAIVAMNLAWKATVFYKSAGMFGPLGTLVAGFAAAYMAIESFRLDVNAQYNKWVGYVETTVNALVKAFNPLIGVINKLIPGGDPLARLSLIKIPRLNTTPASQQGAGFAALNIPQLADGGIAMSPTLALIAEAGEPEAVIPLSKLGNLGGGNNVTIHVNGGDPNAVVDALRRYMQTNGAVPIRIGGA